MRGWSLCCLIYSVLFRSLLYKITSTSRKFWTRWCLNLADLEATWNLYLKHSIWIVLLGHAGDELNILLAIALERVLRLVGIIEIDVLIVRPNRFGVFTNLLQDRLAKADEEIVVPCIIPGVVE